MVIYSFLLKKTKIMSASATF